MNLTYGSLFTGIGGFDLGFDRAGMRCAWQVEIDPHCNQVLGCRYPDAERFGDVRDVGKRNLRPVDVVCGGFPCQDLSVAGKREGLAGERSGLWFEFHRILEELEPRWVVVENVPGLLSSNGGRDFAALLRGLVELGYGVAWRVLDAQYFGVAQRRRRVFIVGSLGDGRAAQVLFEFEGGAWDTAPGKESGEGTTDGVAYSFRNSGRDVDQRNGRTGIGLEEELSYTLQGEQQHAVVQSVAHTLTAPDPNAPLRNGKRQDGGRTDRIPIVFDTTQVTSPGNYSSPKPGDPCHPLASGAHPPAIAFEPRYARNGRGAPDTVVPPLKAESGRTGKGDGAAMVAYAISENQRAELRLTEYSRQIMSGGGKPGQGYPAALTEFGVRRLTPTECERLQGFPDSWTRFDAGGNELSDSARYRMLGNAVAVPVAEWLGRRIVAAEEG